MANLEEKNDGINILLDRVNSKIKKDKVSATGYALWYIKIEIDDVAMRRKSISIDQMMKVQGTKMNRRKDLSSKITFRGNRRYSSKMRRGGY